MAEPLIVDSDETLWLALRLAERLGTTPGDAVARALRPCDEMPAAVLASTTPRLPRGDHDAFIADILARGAAVRATLLSGVSSAHSDLHDEDSLPR